MIERHDQFIVTFPDVPEAVTFIQGVLMRYARSVRTDAGSSFTADRHGTAKAAKKR
jgi:hypothetical protein